MTAPRIFPWLVVLTTVVSAFFLGRLTAPDPVAPELPSRNARNSDQDASRESARGALLDDTKNDPKFRNIAQIRTALDHLEAIANDAGFDHLLKDLLDLTAVDPLAALKYADTRVPSARREETIGAILSAWTRRDPRAAWNWVVANAPANAQRADSVLSEIGKTNPEMAWNFATNMVESHPTADAQSLYVSALRGILYAGDFEEAAAMVMQAKVPGTQGRYDLSSLVATQWASYEPAQAAAWALSLPEGMVRDQALISLGQSWSTTEPQAAADFAAKLPSGNIRTQVLTQALTNWIQHDAAKAGEWLNQFPSSPDLDSAMSAISTAPAVVQDTGTALGWASAITDKELRIQAQTFILADWMRRDRNAAGKYLETSTDLPLETRSEISRRIRKGLVEE